MSSECMLNNAERNRQTLERHILSNLNKGRMEDLIRVHRIIQGD